MKKIKLYTAILMAAALVAAMPVCAMADEAAEGEPQAVTTVGPEDGTHFEMWSFVDAHNEFYGKMVENGDGTCSFWAWTRSGEFAEGVF